MKGLILTAVFIGGLIVWSWARVLTMPPQVQQVGDSLETSILKAESGSLLAVIKYGLSDNGSYDVLDTRYVNRSEPIRVSDYADNATRVVVIIEMAEVKGR